jgi:hypothetical protein
MLTRAPSVNTDRSAPSPCHEMDAACDRPDPEYLAVAAYSGRAGAGQGRDWAYDRRHHRGRTGPSVPDNVLAPILPWSPARTDRVSFKPNLYQPANYRTGFGGKSIFNDNSLSRA